MTFNIKEMGNFCMGDVGGYGIADYLPRVPFLPKFHKIYDQMGY